MLMRPPCDAVDESIEYLERGWKSTYHAFVAAADGAGIARIASANADDGDGGTVQTDEGVHVLDDDADGREDRCDGDTVCREDLLAALDGPGAAGVRGNVVRGGDGKDCDGGEGEELGEHGEGELRGW